MNRVLQKESSKILSSLIVLFSISVLLIFSIFYFTAFPNHENLNASIFISFIIYNILFSLILFYDKNIAFFLFTPLFWYKLILVLFFGVGPLAYYFGTPLTIYFMNTYYFANETTITKISIIYLLSTLIVDIIFLALNRAFTFPDQFSLKKINRKLLLFLSLATGLISKYLIILPASLLGISVYGILYSFSSFIWIGLFLSYDIGIKNFKYKILFYSLIILEIIHSFAFLTKQSLFMTILFSSIIIFFYNKNFKNLFLTAVISAFLYVTVIQNLFLILRSSGENFGLASSQDVGMAIDVIQELPEISTMPLGKDYGALQSWWDRLSYIKYQGYAVDAYDAGNPGKSFDNFKYIFIPRIIYPDKPNLNPGKEYHSLVTGKFNEEVPNSVGPGIFVEAYWNGGWLYVVLTSVYLSVLLFFASKIIIKNLKEKNYTILLFGVNAIYIGRSIDSWFVGQYGGFVFNMIIIYSLFLIIYHTFQSILEIRKVST